MKWFWVVYWDNTVKSPFVSTRDDFHGVSEGSFCKGKVISNWDDRSWIASESSESDGEPDDFLQNHLDLPIFSPRLRSALDTSGITGIQYCPLRVLKSDGSPILGFSIANILTLVPALDMQKSDYDVFPADYFWVPDRGRISGLRLPVLRAKPLHSHNIVRLEEFPLGIYVSDYFRKIFRGAEFTGCAFHEVPTV